MLAYLIIPILMGAGLTIDFINDKYDEYEDEINEALEEQALQDQNDGAPAEGISTTGTDGADAIVGTEYDDRLFGGSGSDSVIGGLGDDRNFMGDGNDVSVGLGGQEDAGDDFIRGGAGADVVIDTLGSDQIFGDIGNDTISSIDGLTDTGDVAQDTAYAPDTVHAGYGQDLIMGDAGDTLTGGHDVDHFVVVAPSDDTHAPAVITDFDPENELLSIVFLDEAPADPSVILMHDFDQGVVRAFVEGEEVATLSGLTAAALQQVSAFVTTLPDLIEAA
jgi:Ca2+-binding RTX toxin-like protein